VAMFFGMSRSFGRVPTSWRALTNAMLLVQFSFLHSLLLSPFGATILKRLAPAVIGSRMATTTYAILASVQVFLLFALWTPSGVIWWRATGSRPSAGRSAPSRLSHSFASCVALAPCDRRVLKRRPRLHGGGELHIIRPDYGRTIFTTGTTSASRNPKAAQAIQTTIALMQRIPTINSNASKLLFTTTPPLDAENMV
jgi:hypothetical protein